MSPLDPRIETIRSVLLSGGVRLPGSAGCSLAENNACEYHPAVCGCRAVLAALDSAHGGPPRGASEDAACVGVALQRAAVTVAAAVLLAPRAAQRDVTGAADLAWGLYEKVADLDGSSEG